MRTLLRLLPVAAVGLTLAACGTTTEERVATGALGGAAAGAVLDGGTGAVVGGVAGAAKGCSDVGGCDHKQYYDQRAGRYYYYDSRDGRYYWDNGEPRY